MEKTDGVLFVFDLFDRSSFTDLDYWYDSCKQLKEEVVGILIGNKSDIPTDHQISKEEAQKFADKYKLQYYECSAKSDKYIKKAIISLIKKIIKTKIDYSSLNSDDSDFEKLKENLIEKKETKEIKQIKETKRNMEINQKKVFKLHRDEKKNSGCWCVNLINCKY